VPIKHALRLGQLRIGRHRVVRAHGHPLVPSLSPSPHRIPRDS
jgi:hypothetical protein